LGSAGRPGEGQIDTGVGAPPAAGGEAVPDRVRRHDPQRLGTADHAFLGENDGSQRAILGGGDDVEHAESLAEAAPSCQTAMSACG
jgi:hypothetical protein